MCVCVCYIQFVGYTSVYVVPSVCNSYVESNSLLLVANDDTTSAVLPTTHKERSPRNDVWNTEPPAIRVCLPRSVDALARLPKHNNRPRCLRVVNSGIHSPHPLDLRGAIIKPPKPPILLNFEHLKHLGPCLQRSLSFLEEKTMDLNFVVLLRNAQTDLAIRIIWTILVPIRLKNSKKTDLVHFRLRFWFP